MAGEGVPMEKVNLLQGDCLELMKNIPDGSVDMVLADLPYGITGCKWDTCIPFDPLWEQYKRVIKSNGVIALFGSEPFSSRLRMSNIKWFKYDWIWHKNTCTGFQHAKNMPLRDYEVVSIFSPAIMGHKSTLGNRRMPYNPQEIKLVNYERHGGLTKVGVTFGKRPSHKDKYIQTAQGYPKAVLNFTNNEKSFHPTQKPVALLEYLMRTYTNEGETVLDNCMGSGSTGVACVKTGRSFIGMELEPGYFETACKRIAEAQEQLKVVM